MKSIIKRAKRVVKEVLLRTPIVSRYFSKAHQTYRGFRHGTYSFVSIATAADWTSHWVTELNDNYDLIIGIPRSGLFIANIIALKLGKPLTTPQLFVQDKFWISKSVQKPGPFKKILIVDDSINSGSAMKGSLSLLKKQLGSKRFKALDITTACLVARNTATSMVDLFYKKLPEPTLFEWNMMHSKGVQLKKLGVDLDGVLCPNFRGDDLEEEVYVDWLKNAPPYLIPAFEIDVIISNRLEKYRAITEEWLKKNGVKYKKLVLWDLQDKSQRGNGYARNKTQCVLREQCDLYYESADWEAQYIHKQTKIPVLCTDTMRMYS